MRVRSIRLGIFCVIGLIMLFTLTLSSRPQEKVHWDVVQKIMEEAFENSHVMENASWLCDVFGPRNAKSSHFRAAAKWAKKRLKSMVSPMPHLIPLSSELDGRTYTHLSI